MRFFKLLFRKLKQKNKSTKSKNSGNLLHRLRNLWKTLSGANRAKTKPRRKKTSSLPRVSGIQIKSRSEMKYIQCSNETRSDIENQPIKASSANEPEPVTSRPDKTIQPTEPIEPPDPVSQPVEIPSANEITPTVPSIGPEASAQELPPPDPEAMIPLNDAGRRGVRKERLVRRRGMVLIETAVGFISAPSRRVGAERSDSERVWRRPEMPGSRPGPDALGRDRRGRRTFRDPARTERRDR